MGILNWLWAVLIIFFGPPGEWYLFFLWLAAAFTEGFTKIKNHPSLFSPFEF
jgi:hypothetical protein